MSKNLWTLCENYNESVEQMSQRIVVLCCPGKRHISESGTFTHSPHLLGCIRRLKIKESKIDSDVTFSDTGLSSCVLVESEIYGRKKIKIRKMKNQLRHMTNESDIIEISHGCCNFLWLCRRSPSHILHRF